MKSAICALTGILAASLAAAQPTVSFTGTVTNAAGQPVAGATILLVKQNLSTTSASDGSYRIPATATREPRRTDDGSPAGFSLDKGMVRLMLDRSAVVVVDLFDMAGRRLVALDPGRLSSGAHVLPLPAPNCVGRTGIVRLRINDRDRYYHFVNFGLFCAPWRNGAGGDAGAPAPAAKAEAVTVLDSLRASYPSLNSVRLYVYTLIDTVDFILNPSDQYCEARQQVVHRINYLRGTVGLGRLARRTNMDTCIDAQTLLDAGSGTAHSAFGRCGEGSQNECPGWPSVEAVISGCTDAMWAEGPPPSGVPCTYPSACYTAHGHYINMTDGGAYGAPRSMSVGFFHTTSGTYWSAQDYWR